MDLYLKKMESYNRLRKRHIPLYFSISLTNCCNLRCVECLRLRDSAGELSTQELKRIINQLAKEGCLYLIFTGGEVFLRKDLYDIADFAKKKGFGLIFLSNGTLIEEENIEKLKKLKCELRITLYGVTTETHDSVTQVKGSFNKTIKGIKLLEKYRIAFSITVVVMKQNFFELEKLQKRLRKKKWKFRNGFVIYPTIEDSLAPLEYRITDEQLEYAVKNGLLDRKDGLSRNNNKEMALSDIGRLTGYISSKGEVYPSLFLRTEIGNLRKDSFHNIWNHSPKLNWLRNLKLKNIPCFNCLYNQDCNRDLGLIQDENANVSVASEWCRVMKARKEELISKYEG